MSVLDWLHDRGYSITANKNKFSVVYEARNLFTDEVVIANNLEAIKTQIIDKGNKHED